MRGTDKLTDQIKMSKLYLIFSVVLMSQASRACNEQNEEKQLIAARQRSDEYFANAFGLTPNNPWRSPYYQSAAHVPEYANPYERRTPLNRQPNYNPFQKYFTSNDYGTDANARRFFPIFKCPTCPTCPTCPSAVLCPTCPTCPAVPVVPANTCPGTTNAADPISISINNSTACTKASTGADNFGTGGCTRVTAAPTGVFTIYFNGSPSADPYPTAFIGIVATSPTTKITVKCGTFKTAVVTTQTRAIGSDKSATETGSAIITVGQGSSATDHVSCSWISS